MEWVNIVDEQCEEPETLRVAVYSPEGDKWTDTKKESSKDRQMIAWKQMGVQLNEEHGMDEWYKARLLAQGYSQKFGLYYAENFSPLVSLLEQGTGGGDVHELAGGVCLNGSKEYGVYRLKQSIYGLKQFPQCRNFALDAQLKRMLTCERC